MDNQTTPTQTEPTDISKINILYGFSVDEINIIAAGLRKLELGTCIDLYNRIISHANDIVAQVQEANAKLAASQMASDETVYVPFVDESVDAPVPTPVEAPAPVDTPVEAPVDAPVEAPVDAPVEAPAETPAPVDTPATPAP